MPEKLDGKDGQQRLRRTGRESPPEKPMPSAGDVELSSNEIEVVGPISAEEHPELVAYTTRSAYKGRSYIVCILLFDEDQHLLKKHVKDFFDLTLDHAEQQLKDWKDVPCVILELQRQADSSSVQASFYVHDTKQTDLRKIAEEVLSGTFYRFSKTTGEETYSFKKSPIPGSDFNHYDINKGEGRLSRHMLAKDDSAFEFLTDLEPLIDQVHAGMYLAEVEAFLSKDRPREAFRSFYYYVLLTKDSPPEASNIVNSGMPLITSLMRGEMYDYAEMAAVIVAEHAEAIKAFDDAARARRMAAISSETLGLIQQTREHYEKALEFLDLISDLRLRMQLHMSFGISLIMLLNDHETQSFFTKSRQLAQTKMLDLSERQLNLAKELLADAKDTKSRWSSCAIELDLIRIGDLRGGGEAALEGLRNFVNSEEFLQDPRLVLTALIYNACILKKLADRDSRWVNDYHASLNRVLPGISRLPFDKQCLLFALAGDISLANGQANEAVEIFQAGYDVQLNHLKRSVRPPRPDAVYGGWAAIDLCGKLQSALHHASQSKGVNALEAPRLQALRLADDAKARYFKRDLAFLIPEPEAELSGHLARRGEGIRRAFAEGQVDHRILLADYEYFLEKDIPPESSQTYARVLRSDDSLTLDDIKQVLSSQNEFTLLSLYVTQRVTFAYLFDAHSQEPKVYVIEVGLEELQTIAQNLHVGIHGNRLYPPISAQHPEQNQKFFAPFLRLAEKFEPISQHLQSTKLLIVSPHGLWHNLPLHVLLLPPLWKSGKDVSMLYVPSIRLYRLLQKRYEHARSTQRKRIGLFTAPDLSSIQKFASAHKILEGIFSEVDPNFINAFGEEATDDRFLHDTLEVGVHHVFAHGHFEQGQDAMSSGMWLAGKSGLPFRAKSSDEVNGGAFLTGAALMANSTRADHITLQACSVGKSQQSAGDELWGVGRALIAAGAGSVLAPLWNIDLDSSTELMSLFYDYWLKRKLPKWEAWTRAQQELWTDKQHPEWNHFYHWGAFRLFGH